MCGAPFQVATFARVAQPLAVPKGQDQQKPRICFIAKVDASPDPTEPVQNSKARTENCIVGQTYGEAGVSCSAVVGTGGKTFRRSGATAPHSGGRAVAPDLHLCCTCEEHDFALCLRLWVTLRPAAFRIQGSPAGMPYVKSRSAALIHERGVGKKTGDIPGIEMRGD